MYAVTRDEIALCMRTGRCISCGELFSDENVFTEAGWREVKISCMCEECFDELFEDEDD